MCIKTEVKFTDIMLYSSSRVLMLNLLDLEGNLGAQPARGNIGELQQETKVELKAFYYGQVFLLNTLSFR